MLHFESRRVAGSGHDQQAPSRPNIVVFLTDDQGYADLSSFGHPTINTPSIDRMADLGLSTVWDGKYRAVSRWYERLQARPAFKATYYAGSRVSDFLELQPLYRPD